MTVSGNLPISVVVPVYNAGEYLRGAVDSVLAQTFRDFELILIDDGSTDGSGAVCDEYAARDPRVRVRHGRNGGICASRNAGMEMARGEWLAFCDHDDAVRPTWLEKLYAAAGKTDCVYVQSGWEYYERLADGTTKLKERSRCDTYGWSLDDRGMDFSRRFTERSQFVWNGLYSRVWLADNGIRFDPFFRFGGEDWLFNSQVAAKAGKGLWIGDRLYVHYKNEGLSASSGNFEARVSGHEYLLDRQIEAFAPLSEYVCGFCLLWNLSMITRYLLAGKDADEKKSVVRRLSRKYRKYLSFGCRYGLKSSAAMWLLKAGLFALYVRLQSGRGNG